MHFQGQPRLVWLYYGSDSQSELRAFCPCSSLRRVRNRQALRNTSWMTQSSLRTEFLGRRCFNHPNVRVHFLFSVAALQSVGARGTFLENRGFSAADAEQHVSPGDTETGEAWCLLRGGPPFTGREQFLPRGLSVRWMHPTDVSVRVLWLGFSEDRICSTQTSPPRWSRWFCRGL